MVGHGACLWSLCSWRCQMMCATHRLKRGSCGFLVVISSDSDGFPASKEGLTFNEIARQVGAANREQARKAVLPRKTIPAETQVWVPGPGRLGLAEREEITIGVARSETFTAIAKRLGVNRSTVTREVNSNGGRTGYRPGPHTNALDVDRYVRNERNSTQDPCVTRSPST